VSVSFQKQEQLILESINRLLSRAANARSLGADDLLPRVRAVVEKTFPNSTSAQETRQFVESLHADDLCLVIACERGDEAAWRDIFAKYSSTVKAAARKITSNTEDAEDLANSIWAELHGLKTVTNGKPSGKLGYYSGRGSLAGWLRAVVAQLAIDAHRKQARLVQIEENREFENLAHEADEKDLTQFHTTEENPEQSLIEKRGREDVENALKKAIGELEAEDKLLVKLYYFDNLNLKQAGAILGFHEATASRRVVKIQTNLRKRVEQILEKENGWKGHEIKQVLATAASFLQTDVEKLLKSEENVQENQTSGVP
jgi:RNA polymerase sigma-70 factor, ECF subfamily